MGAGRLAADSLAARRGGPWIAGTGATLAAAGLIAALATTDPGLAVACLAAMGLGLSALFPLTLQAAGRQAAPGPALAAVSTLGYAGFLTGPPALGLLAEVTSLRAALLLVCALCVLAALLTRKLGSSEREDRHDPTHPATSHRAKPGRRTPEQGGIRR